MRYAVERGKGVWWLYAVVGEGNVRKETANEMGGGVKYPGS